MLKKLAWEENAVYSLKLREDLYTVVQMRKNYIMQFFDIFHSNDEWSGIDLNECRTLHFGFVSITGLKKMFSQRLSPEQVQPSRLPIETKMLRADLSMAPDYSAKVVELTDSYDTVDSRELSGRLSATTDRDTIYKYELDGSLGSPEKLAKRLIRYFETGVNWDDAKGFLFKDIAPPPPDPAWKKAS